VHWLVVLILPKKFHGSTSLVRVVGFVMPKSLWVVGYGERESNHGLITVQSPLFSFDLPNLLKDSGILAVGNQHAEERFLFYGVADPGLCLREAMILRRLVSWAYQQALGSLIDNLKV
jgi:hypothetical protein